MELENGAMSRLAVLQVSQRDTEEIIEAVVVRVVAVIITALTVQAQVPFSCRQEEETKTQKVETRLSSKPQ